MSLDAKIEYLKMIQAVITRVLHYGFLLKGWGVTLIAAILALAAGSGKPDLLLIGLFPTLVFWTLDAFFLHTERNYRALYARGVRLAPDEIDFDLSPTGEHTWDTPPPCGRSCSAVPCSCSGLQWCLCSWRGTG